MVSNRITEHPVLDIYNPEIIHFYWNKQKLEAHKGEMISAALFANDIKIFGHHPKDGSSQGIYCANGQCARCTVIANGVSVKACMTEVKENMIVQSADGLADLSEITEEIKLQDIEEIETEILIIGGGPAGLSAAIKVSDYDSSTLIIDDKSELGGKLVLQTHKFFGSQEDSFAGKRGNDIGRNLAKIVNEKSNITIWTNSTVLYVFSDKKVGIVKEGIYKLVKPKVILNAAGAREKFLKFSGNALAGIYGAGAFQTLVNRDLVRPTKRLFIIGGGNVGLIAGYHALQAGIEVVGLVEAMPKCGGYKVHEDKLKRFGVPVYTSHSILSANGNDTVKSITISQIDKTFSPIAGTEKTFKCDTILVAVGLESLSEFNHEAKLAGIPIFGAGDALEIAEASSAMFNGKIAGLKLAQFLKITDEAIPEEWKEKAELLKSHPGKIIEKEEPEITKGIFPNIFCVQEIPCNPCSTVCPTNAINMIGDPIMGLPNYEGKCIGCGKCLTICPGLAITLVDYREDENNPIVTLPYELNNFKIEVGDLVKAVDIDGNILDELPIVKIIENKNNRMQLVKIQSPKNIAKKIASFQVQKNEISKPQSEVIVEKRLEDNQYVCLCERVKVSDVRKLVRDGITDMNQIKAITRLGMGACGAKTCENLAMQIMREEGVEPSKVVLNKRRPVFVEIPIGTFAGEEK
ncbi:MAG: FAD-dependent oxidoreductase [Candidatus Cloacimonadota bacterium]|nr:FAD-dependent oxidoreductase [Candidatus Cloacimonadota bacterium]